MTTQASTKWPKPIRKLTDEQVRISNEWMKIWLDQHLSKNPSLRLIDDFSKRYAKRSARPGSKTLELGAGVGSQCASEDLANQEYYCCELREDLAAKIRERFPLARTTVGDCQTRLDFADGYFDRILAIHVLEHLPALPDALKECHRLLRANGSLSVLIPCEGGMGYDVARRVSAKRLFEKRFNWDYYDYIRTEHVSTANEILEELSKLFDVTHRTFFPALVPSIHLNLVIGLTLRPKR